MHPSRGGFTLLLLAYLLGGCATGGVVSISEPNVINAAEYGAIVDGNGILSIGDISISVKPQNARVGLLAVGPLVPLIPVGSGNELGKGKPFQVVIQFETSGAYTFMAGDATLLHGGAEYRAAQSAGPLSRTGVPRELQRASRGHDWVCNDVFTMNPDALLRDVSLRHSRSCFVLQFPVVTPNPDQPFHIRLRGLKKDGRAVELPEIEFRRGTTGGYSLLG